MGPSEVNEMDLCFIKNMGPPNGSEYWLQRFGRHLVDIHFMIFTPDKRSVP